MKRPDPAEHGLLSELDNLDYFDDPEQLAIRLAYAIALAKLPHANFLSFKHTDNRE